MALQVTAPSLSSVATSAASNSDLGRKDIFLKLLVAQMKNQNPLKPQDATQMSSQLAQFNMVEQQTSTNTWLKQIAGNGGVGGGSDIGGLNVASAGYLGRTVIVNQNIVQYDGTPQRFSTNLPVDAASVQVVVRDSAGRAVRTMSMGSMTSGYQNMTWDGLADNGTTESSGTYTLEMIAIDAQGFDITANIQRSGLVDAVRLASGAVQLMVGGSPASLADVTEVRL